MHSHPRSLASWTTACPTDQTCDGTSCVLPLPRAPQEHDKYFVELSAPVTKLLPGPRAGKRDGVLRRYQSWVMSSTLSKGVLGS